MPDRRLVDEFGGDHAQAGAACLHGLLEGRSVDEPSGADDRLAGQPEIVAHDRSDVGGHSQLDAGRPAIGAVVRAQRFRQLSIQGSHDPDGWNMRRHDDKETVAAVLDDALIPHRPERRTRHVPARQSDDLAVVVVPVECAERHHVGAQHGAVLAREQMPVRGPSPGRQGWLRREAAGRIGLSRFRPLLGEPVVDLLFHEVEHARVSINEAGEVLGFHHQRADRAECDHRGGADANPQGGALAHELPGAALGDDPCAAVLGRDDPHPAAEDDDDVIRRLAFPHDPGTADEGPLARHRGERLTLGLVEGIQEVHAHDLSMTTDGRRQEGGRCAVAAVAHDDPFAWVDGTRLRLVPFCHLA